MRRLAKFVNDEVVGALIEVGASHSRPVSAGRQVAPKLDCFERFQRFLNSRCAETIEMVGVIHRPTDHPVKTG
jgi:hypothetical protein